MRKLIPWNKIKAEYLQGVTPKEIAKKYDTTAKKISDRAYNEKWVQEKAKILENVRENTQKRIEGLTNLALNTLEDILIDFDSDKSVKVQASKALLDISGLKSAKIEQTNINDTVKVEII